MEYVSVTIPKATLKDMHKSLLMQHIVEEQIRHEHGLEASDYPASLLEIEKILGISPEMARELSYEIEDQLWEYSWYTYTDEWAWFRAQKDLLKDLGEKAKQVKQDELERRIDEIYRKKFDTFVGEIDMHEELTLRKNSSKKRAS